MSPFPVLHGSKTDSSMAFIIYGHVQHHDPSLADFRIVGNGKRVLFLM